ncbi:MAG: zf-HC2 domain-containing protein, partial [Chloroflexota bacterium]|nr:zf-HC2 domain-containing protein [Chloroflexota bacterium]
MSDSGGTNDRHERYRELISAHLDGGLPAAERSELAEHQAACERCRRVERDYAEQRHLLRSLPWP